MLVNGMVCYFPGWGVSKRDGVLVNEMGCYFLGWGVIKRFGVLLIRDGLLVYGMLC